MELPKIEFSKWYGWYNRESIENISCPGVYILAKFKEVPKGKASPLDKNIIYIGETCNNDFKGRLLQFHKSAFKSKSGHSGGFSYNKKYGDNPDGLYVAIMPIVNLTDNILPPFIRYIERKLILEFVLKNGNKLLNKK